MYMPPSATASAGSYGSGATHTVWVAPTQGVLRYVPFAVNASVGDTVKFIWGANNHTVTKSSELDLCNKTGDSPFASGEQNKTFVCKNHITRSLHSSRKLTNIFS
jgi:plastocyanin